MKENSKKKTINDGRYMHGLFDQYIFDSEKINSKEEIVMRIISRYTFGRRLKFGYIQQDKFLSRMSNSVLVRERKSLIEKGLLKFTPTKAFSRYEIILPEEIADEFVFNFIKNPKAYEDKIQEGKTFNENEVDKLLEGLQ